MNRIIKKAVMQRAWELKRNQPIRRFKHCLAMAWVEIKSALHSNERMVAIENIKRVCEEQGLSAMDSAIAQMKALGEIARAQRGVA